MWNNLLTKEFVDYAKKVTQESEDVNTWHTFIKHLSQRANYLDVAGLVFHWKKYTDLQKTHLAIHHAGVYHASRFIILMDYLSKDGRDV